MNNNHQNAASNEQQNKNASGGELPQKQVVKAQKAKAARQKLIQLSQQAKDKRKELIANAKTPLDAIAAGEMTINEIIMLFYRAETACTEFKTFAEWKKAGYSVNKGEKGFLVWGKPRRVKDTMTTEDGEELQADEWEFFPVCYLFNEKQVSPMGTKPEPKKEEEKEKPEPENAEPENVSQDEAENVAASPFVAIDYEERLEGRRQRLEKAAINRNSAADAAHNRSRALVENIPFGQPILVGHHSERGHRNAIDKSWRALGKSVSLTNEAENLERRASAVGTGGISTTDPEAVQKLKNKLSGLEKSQEIMKAANKALKKNDDQALADLGLTDKQIIEIKRPDFAGRTGFPAYALQNNNAEIRRTKQRIADIERLHNSEPLEFENDDFRVSVENGQIVIVFHDGKPSGEVRGKLKSNGFKWSRYQSAWVRKATMNALGTAENLIESLKSIEEIY